MSFWKALLVLKVLKVSDLGVLEGFERGFGGVLGGF
jgi:hypothetical protein